MIRAFSDGIIYCGENIYSNHALLVEKEKIKAIVPAGNIPGNAEVINCAGHIITPGLIDLQIYGGGGYLFSANPSRAALEAMTGALNKSGTTLFLVTLATNSLDIYRQAIKVVRENPHPSVAGIHLEGPFINHLKKGAHLEEYILDTDTKKLESLLEEGKGIIKMMTLAPECCTKEMIHLLKKYGVIVSAGHSNATYAEAMEGFSLGIEAVTHLFNAMSPMHHRDTGLTGASFLSEQAMASIIADGIHVDYATLRISKTIMGKRLFLISDAVESCDSGPYQHQFNQDRFQLPDGTLSGSALSMLKAVRNCVQEAGIPLEEALRMASLYPAQLLEPGTSGSFMPGNVADILVMDQSFSLQQVYVHGKRV